MAFVLTFSLSTLENRILYVAVKIRNAQSSCQGLKVRRENKTKLKNESESWRSSRDLQTVMAGRMWLYYNQAFARPVVSWRKNGSEYLVNK